MSLNVLAIETSNPTAGDTSGVAVGEVSESGKVRMLAVAHLRSGDRHDDQLVALIDRAVRDAGLSPGELDRVAVSVGPGGYTALRIAVSVANMVALATGAKVVAVPTARVAAFAATDVVRPLLVLLASKGDSAHVTRFDDGDHLGQVLGILSRDAILRLGAATILADGHAPEGLVEAARSQGISTRSPGLNPEDCLKVAVTIEPSPGNVVLPFYPRQPEAITRWMARGT